MPFREQPLNGRFDRPTEGLAVLKPPHLRAQFVMDTGWNYFTRMTRHHGAFTPGLVYPYVFRLAKNGRHARKDAQIRAALEAEFGKIVGWIRRYPLQRGESLNGCRL